MRCDSSPISTLVKLLSPGWSVTRRQAELVRFEPVEYPYVANRRLRRRIGRPKRRRRRLRTQSAKSSVDASRRGRTPPGAAAVACRVIASRLFGLDRTAGALIARVSAGAARRKREHGLGPIRRVASAGVHTAPSSGTTAELDRRAASSSSASAADWRRRIESLRLAALPSAARCSPRASTPRRPLGVGEIAAASSNSRTDSRAVDVAPRRRDQPGQQEGSTFSSSMIGWPGHRRRRIGSPASQ